MSYKVTEWVFCKGTKDEYITRVLRLGSNNYCAVCLDRLQTQLTDPGRDYRYTTGSTCHFCGYACHIGCFSKPVTAPYYKSNGCLACSSNGGL